MREVVRDVDQLVRFRAEQRMVLGLLALVLGQIERHLHVSETLLEIVDRQHVAVAHHEIDVVERDAFGIQAIVDDLLIKAAGVLLAREALLQNGKSNLAIAKKTRADIVIVGVDSENVGRLLRHRSLLNCVGIAPHKRFCARLIVKIHLIAEGGRCKSDDGITGEYGSSSAGRDRNVEVVSRSRRTGSSPVHRVRCTFALRQWELGVRVAICLTTLLAVPIIPAF